MSKFFTDSDLDSLVFFQVPKVLVLGDKYKKMKPNALKLYMVLFDRMKLSMENGWKNEDGRYYVRMSQEGASEIFGWSPTTFRAMKKELEDFGLLLQDREGQGKSNRLYILKCDYDESDIYVINKSVNTEMEENEKVAQSIDTTKKNNFCSSRKTEVDLLEEQLLTPNNNNFNKNNFNNNNKNLNPNPLDIYEILWDTSIPQVLKNRIKIMIHNKQINLSSEQILLIENAYKYQIGKGFVNPNCRHDDSNALNDFEFSNTVGKMLEKCRNIKNMRGMIKEWVENALSYKKDQHQVIQFGKDAFKNSNIPLYNWMEDENER